MTSFWYDSSMDNNSKQEVDMANTVVTSSTRDATSVDWKDSFFDDATLKKSVDVMNFYYVLTRDKIKIR